MTEPALYSAALIMGLFSAPHCVAMCGGLVAAMGLHTTNASIGGRLYGVLSYNVGRLMSYVLLGFIVGIVGMAFHELLPGAGFALRIVAATLLILTGFHISGWWLGLRHLEQALYSVWTRLQGLLTNGGNRKSRGTVLGGLLWGCLPCGLVYSALSMAMTQQSAWQGALFMLFFGLGTLPALVGIGLISTSFGSWLRQTWVRAGAGVALMSYGIWTFLGIFGSQHVAHSM